MNSWIVPTVVLMAAWLIVLTLAVLSLVRQVAVMSVHTSLRSSGGSLDDDGLPVGSPIPVEFQETIPELEARRAFVLVLSPKCAPCREVVTGLRGRSFLDPVYALVLDSTDPLHDGFGVILGEGFKTVHEPGASRVVESLKLSTRPFAFGLEDGRIVAKRVLRGPEDFISFVDDIAAAEQDHTPTSIKGGSNV